MFPRRAVKNVPRPCARNSGFFAGSRKRRRSDFIGDTYGDDAGYTANGTEKNPSKSPSMISTLPRSDMRGGPVRQQPANLLDHRDLSRRRLDSGDIRQVDEHQRRRILAKQGDIGHIVTFEEIDELLRAGEVCSAGAKARAKLGKRRQTPMLDEIVRQRVVVICQVRLVKKQRLNRPRCPAQRDDELVERRRVDVDEPRAKRGPSAARERAEAPPHAEQE